MVCLVFVWLLLKTFQPVVLSIDDSLNKEVFKDGHFILGGFFPVHDSGNDSICGKIKAEGLIELEAMLFTVHNINNDPNILRGIILGVLAVDSCDSVPGALEGAVNFAKGFIVKEENSRTEDKRQYLKCSNTNSSIQYKNGKYEKVVAIIGGHSSWVSMQVADVMNIYKIPQISYQSTNPALSDTNRYKYFFRTVPPLGHQIDAILEILGEFNWSYVSVVYADSEYGNKGFDILKKKAPDKKICFSMQKMINVENSEEKDYDLVIKDLLNRKAKVVILFSDTTLARNLMSAATRKEAYDNFVWIGSTAWVSRDSVTKGNERVLEGTIGVSHDIKPLKGFKEYLKTRSLRRHLVVKEWFSEYCKEKLESRPDNSGESCSENDKLPSEWYLQTTPAVQYVRNAVYAIAKALDYLCRDKFGNDITSCSKIDGEQLKDYLKNVTYHDENGESVQFDESGDGPPKYSILNFRKTNESKYEWKEIGTYSNIRNSESKKLVLENNGIFKHDQRGFPDSYCSPRCKDGQVQNFLDDSKCCWHCGTCKDDEYINQTKCERCPNDEFPTKDRNGCEEIEPTYMSFTDPWAKGCIIFSVFGIVATLCVGVVLQKYWNTPVFTVSGKEFSCVLLIGIFLLFITTFILVAPPCAASCGAVRFFSGFFYIISYATIAVKTRHISRLCDQKVSNKKPKPLKTKSLLLIIMALVSVEGTINFTWLLHSQPQVAIQNFASRRERFLICKGSETEDYLVGLMYPFLLTLVCTIYALRIRDFSGAFNESRYINLTNYTTCVLWVAFLPVFLTNDKNFLRVVMLSLLLNLSAFVQLVCLFLPKVYIALRRPEKNVHENVMGYDVRQSTPKGS